MPRIIEYPLVLEQMNGRRFKSLYYNSGAFGFPADAAARTLAWIGPEDPSIRPAARELTRSVPEPYDQTLAKLATALWQEQLPGYAWVMPMSHWAFELGHGSHEWLPALIDTLGLDPALLESRNNAAAIEFGMEESPRFEQFVSRLLRMLSNSDFAIAFPGRSTLCTLHHHKQLWWTSTDEEVMEAVDRMAR